MSASSMHQQYSWWNPPEDQSQDDMPRGSFHDSFASSSPPFDDYPAPPAPFFSQDPDPGCSPTTAGQIDLDINDPLILNQHAEPWSAVQRLNFGRPNVVSLTPPGYADAYAQQQYPAQLHSQASGSVYGHTSPSTYITVPEDRSIYSADASSEKQYRPTISPKSASRPKTGRSRASSTYSARTSNSLTKRKADDDEDYVRCPDCPTECRTESELKKHRLKHYKPNKCDVPDCSRQEGFTTPNDVWRHKASIHKIYQPGSKIYLCAAPECLNKSAKEEKHWPRLDNFKQHIERMHESEDIDLLVEKSTICVDALGRDSLPQHMQRTHMLQAVQGGIIVTQNTSTSVHFNQQQPVLTAQQTPVQAPSWPSPEDQHLRPPEDRRRSQSSNSKRRQVQSVSSAASRATQPLPPIVLHQSADESRQEKVPHPDNLQLQQLTKALTAASTNKNVAPERAILEVLQKFQLDNGLLYHPPVQDISLADAEGDAEGDAVKDVAMQDVPTDEAAAGEAKPAGDKDVKPGIQCAQCSKVLQRDCDMRKHRMRHDKPFGCTFNKCTGSFGSKNDWKRHEQSQHFQSAAWTCRLTPTGSQQPCAHLYFDEAKFRSHLRRTHKDIRDHDAQVEMSSIGHNSSDSFWCGFCRKVIKVVEGDSKAWHERYNRIGEHFDMIKCVEGGSKGWHERFNHVGEHFVNSDKDPSKHISNWLPPRGHKTKGELKVAEPDCNEDERFSDDECALPLKGLSPGSSSSVVDVKTVDPRSMTTKKTSRSKLVYCRSCTQGPFNSSCQTSCPNCGIHFE